MKEMGGNIFAYGYNVFNKELKIYSKDII